MVPCYGLHQAMDQLALGTIPTHDICVPPPVKVPCVPHILEPGTIGWPGGYFITHKVGDKTFFDGSKAVQQGHDCGYLIPHIGPPNVLLAVHILFSKHKVMFPVSKVLIEGKALGTYLIAFLGLICSQVVSRPSGIVIPIRCTVFATMSALDIFLGLVFIAIDMAIDKLWDKYGKGISDKIASKISSAISKKAIEAAAKAAVKEVVEPVLTDVILKPAAGFLGRQVAAKAIDHIAKSFVVGPILQGLPFLPIQIASPQPVLPSVGVGRGNKVKITFFPRGGQTGN